MENINVCQFNFNVYLHAIADCNMQINSICLMNDATILVSASLDGKIRIFDVNSGKFEYSTMAHPEGISILTSVSNDNENLIITGGSFVLNISALMTMNRL